MSKPLFSIKQKVHARLNAVFQAATVMHIEEDSSGDNEVPSFRYYVQWLEHDRRMDRWLVQDDLRASAGGPFPRAAKAKAAVTGVATRRTRLNDENCGTDDTSKEMGDTGGLRNTTRAVSYSKGVTSTGVRSRANSSFFCLPKNINCVIIGPYELDTWYFSPYHIARPTVRAQFESCATSVHQSAELTVRRLPTREDRCSTSSYMPSSNFCLHICPYCVHPFLDRSQVERHLHLCARHPPGKEVYRDLTAGAGPVILFEVEGREELSFCQHLSLLSKLFLEQKALDYDTSPFLFYVMTLVTPYGCEVVGYFSREKECPESYNLSCIMTLPHFQGLGAGNFLINASYEMSRRMGISGSPEKPLSDLGERTYRSYWCEKIIEAVLAQETADMPFTTECLSRQTGISTIDISSTMQILQLMDTRPDGRTGVKLSPAVLEDFFQRKKRILNSFHFDSSLLSWNPAEYIILKRKNALSSMLAMLFRGCDESGYDGSTVPSQSYSNQQSNKCHSVGQKRPRP
eukprot:Tbor_TRINITY_DN1187_c0_g1::TRINITY_DN1187_c0_g1_i1::g.15563::m.15563/K11304/TIP60, KAT5, ESA1; histone acetyltransferase HTATIP